MYAVMTNRLDENVVTLSMLGTVPSAQHSQGSTRRTLSEVERKWCCLLDELSWLCDYKTGGKSVTSVAAQTTATGNVFWFASNKDTRLLIERQLRWILAELQLIATNDTVDSEEVRWRLFKRSIVFNHRRVEFYWEKMHSLVQSAGLSSTDRQKDLQLVGYLERLIELRDNHEQLCLLAFRYRGSPMSIQLRQRILQSKPCPIWQAIRHYIGRLGSWWNACSILVATARLDPRIFLEAQVKAVRHKMSPGTDLSRGRSELARVEYATSTQQEKERWSPSASGLLTRQWGDGAAAEFTARVQRRRAETIVHAELLLLEHFYQRTLEFAEGVRYVGCSKLSCYCCHVYMNVHPLTVLPRPCHGNTWTRWAMPVRPSDRKGKFGDQDANLLVEMICRTSHEIETSSFAATMVKNLESTTGIDPEFSNGRSSPDKDSYDPSSWSRLHHPTQTSAQSEHFTVSRC